MDNQYASWLNHSVAEEIIPDIKRRFGRAIKKRRSEIGISQEELAERSNLHRTYIADIERGTRNVSLENIDRLAKALNIPIATLFANYNVEVEE